MREMHRKKGFTIIEVVLVLAIGGLIFLMVFVALPALQRSQRNTQRRRAADEVFAAVQTYLGNNNRLPFNYGNTAASRFDTNFITRYVDSTCEYKGIEYTSKWGDQAFGYGFNDCRGNFTDPDGETYSILVMNGNSGGFLYDDEINHYIYLASGCKCGSSKEGTRVPTGKKNDFLVFTKMEGGAMYCVDNS